MKRAGSLLAVVLLILVATGSGINGHRWQPVRAQAALVGAVGCDSSHRALRFPLASDRAGSLLVQAPDDRNSTLNVGNPSVAATCQVVLEDTSTDVAPPFTLEAGTLAISIDGPALIVESGGSSYSLTCGDPGTPRSCPGGEVAMVGGSEGNAATGAGALTFHLALQPGYRYQPGAVQVIVAVQAVFRTAAGDEITLETRVALVPPVYQLTLTADRLSIGSGPQTSAVVTARLRQTRPTGCVLLDGGSYDVCEQVDAPVAIDAPVEAGTVVFTTTLGTFSNTLPRIDVACGDVVAAVPGVVVSTAGEAAAIRTSCTSVSARLLPVGRAGDAVVSARFIGAVTGAFAVDAVPITVAPQPLVILLGGGCTTVTAPRSIPAGSPVALIAESATPSSAVVGIWLRNPQTGLWEAGYLRDGDAPVQAVTVDPGASISICVDAVVKYPLT